MRGIVAAFLFLVASYCFGQIAKADTVPFSVDLSHSKFKFESPFFGQEYFYTINGKEINDNTPGNFFIIAVMRNVEHNFEARKAYAKFVIDNIKEKSPNAFGEEKETQIDNIKAYEACYIYTDSVKHAPIKLKEYGVIFGNDKTTIGFLGIAVKHYRKTIKEFRKIARSIKIK